VKLTAVLFILWW